MDKIIVVIAGNPSGIAATARDTATNNMSFQGISWKIVPTRKVKIAIPIIIYVNDFPSCSWSF